MGCLSADGLATSARRICPWSAGRGLNATSSALRPHYIPSYTSTLSLRTPARVAGGRAMATSGRSARAAPRRAGCCNAASYYAVFKVSRGPTWHRSFLSEDLTYITVKLQYTLVVYLAHVIRPRSRNRHVASGGRYHQKLQRAWINGIGKRIKEQKNFPADYNLIAL